MGKIITDDDYTESISVIIVSDDLSHGRKLLEVSVETL